MYVVYNVVSHVLEPKSSFKLINRPNMTPPTWKEILIEMKFTMMNNHVAVYE